MRTLLVLSLFLAVTPAFGGTARYGIMIGNNRGRPGEVPLRYAQSDAVRLRDALVDVGGFTREDLTLLEGTGTREVRAAFASIEARVRRHTATGGQALLFVYYSGHADASALHLGAEDLPHADLRRWVEGSGATLRVVIVDSCGSGGLLRGKGGAPRAPFSIDVDDRISGEGTITLSSSRNDELSFESDDLGGSIFTHYLVSGLRGAADADRDGMVTLEEVYRHTYDRTLGTTTRSWSGPQHPSYSYSLHGQGSLVIARLTTLGRDGAVIELPKGRTYLLFRGKEGGSLVAEVQAGDAARTLVVVAGPYFVQARGSRDLREGVVVLRAGERQRVEDRSLTLVAYGRTTARGGRNPPSARDRVWGALMMRTPLGEGASPCAGAAAGVALDFSHVTLVPRLFACRSGFDNQVLAADAVDFGGAVLVAYTWRPWFATVGLGVEGGLSVLHQSFTTTGLAPDRTTLAGQVGVAAFLVRDLTPRLHLAAELGIDTYFFRGEASMPDTGTGLTSAVVLRTLIALGTRW